MSEVGEESEVLVRVREFLRDRARGRDTSMHAAALAAATEPVALVNLEEWEGKIRGELFVESNYRPGLLASFRVANKRTVSWIDTCSWNGFKRERAVLSMSKGVDSPFVLAVLARRLNDWVPEVRRAAKESIPKSARCSSPRHVAEVLYYLLPNLETWGRIEHDGREALLRLLSLAGVSDSLAAKIQGLPAGPAATVLQQASRSAELDAVLLSLARSSVQPAARARAYQMLLAGRASWVVERKWEWTNLQWCKGRFRPVLEERPLTVQYPRGEVLEMAVDDRSPMVRRVAGSALLSDRATPSAESLRLAERLALDDYPSVAELGEYVLARDASQQS